MLNLSKLLLRLLGLMCFISVNSVQAEIVEDVKATIKQRVDFGLSQSIVIGSYDQGKVQYFSYGRTDIKGGRTPDKNTVYEIGSISKLFTATLLSHHAIEQRLNLKTPVFQLLPNTCRSEPLKAITLEMLATHHSGLPRMPENYTAPYYSLEPIGYSEKALCAQLSNLDNKVNSDKSYQYSNLAYGLLGYVLEQQIGVSLESQLKANIFTPLAMDSTSIDNIKVSNHTLAQGHHDIIRTPLSPNGTLDGAGAVKSSAKDLLAFLVAHLTQEQTPPQQTLEQAMKQTTEARANAWQGTDIGLGWHIQKSENGQTIHWHNGSQGGFHSFAAFDGAANKAVVVLANSGGEGNDDLGFFTLDHSRSIKPTPTYQQVKLDRNLLQNYVGVYDTEFGIPIVITLEGDQLKAQFGDQFALNLYPETKTHFFYRAILAKISFDFDSEGKEKLLLHQDGETYPATLRQ